MPDIEESGAVPSGDSGNLWEVAVALPLFQTLTYRLPPALQDQARVGCLVQVPVGRRQVTGYILGPGREIPHAAIREVLAVLDPLPRFGPELVPLWRWVADYYQYPLGEALSHFIPGGSRPTGPKRESWVTITPQAIKQPPPQRQGPRAREILDYLRQAGDPVAVRDLRKIFPTCAAILKRLVEQGFVTREERRTFSDPFKDQPDTLREPPLTLVPGAGKGRAGSWSEGIRGENFAPFLLHGVTASGKTEVYLAAAQEALDQGRQVLVLLPEIALTHPVALEFRRRFGERVALLHSGLTDSQRLDQWRRSGRGRGFGGGGGPLRGLCAPPPPGPHRGGRRTRPGLQARGGPPLPGPGRGPLPGQTGGRRGAPGVGHPIGEHFFPGAARALPLSALCPAG